MGSGKMAKSIMQNEKVCYVTGSTFNLHKHHVFYGTANRRKSEQWGCWVWLRGDFHNMSSHGVHTDKELDLRIKRETQTRFEELHGHDLFMKEFGRSWL